MAHYEDIMMIEGVDGYEVDDEQGYYAGIQRTINAGTWSLQGSFGRTMMEAIESGHCMLGTARATDYWGNTIPARTDVQDGTKGSRLFVVEARGEDWAVHMEKQP